MDSQFRIDPTSLITLKNDRPLTTSLKVAEVFGKDHYNVLKAIKALKTSEKFTDVNFNVSEYRDSTGRALPMYEMTKNGLVMLAGSFTGAKAAAIWEAYIEAFDMMAEALEARCDCYTAPPAFGMGRLLEREVSLNFGCGEAVAEYCDNGHLWLVDTQIDRLLGYKMRRPTLQLFYRHKSKFPQDSYQVENLENGATAVLLTPRAWAIVARYSDSGYANDLALAAVENFVTPGYMEVGRTDYLELAECAHEARDKMRGLASGSRELWMDMQDARDSAEDAYLRLESDQRFDD